MPTSSNSRLRCCVLTCVPAFARTGKWKHPHDRVRRGKAKRQAKKETGMKRHGYESHGRMESDIEFRLGGLGDVARHAPFGGGGRSLRLDAETARQVGYQYGRQVDGLFSVPVAVDCRALHLRDDPLDWNVGPGLARSFRRGMPARTCRPRPSGTTVSC